MMISVKRPILILLLLFNLPMLWSQQVAPFVWHSPSQNSAESMPCGGGDIGLNVWVENGDLLFYISRSGTFDENNTMLKQGRIRLRLSPNPFVNAKDFVQKLDLENGGVEISASGTTVSLWVDVFKPVIHVDWKSSKALSAKLFYENWRYKDRLIKKRGESNQCSYKWILPERTVTKKDSVWAEKNGLCFVHQNDQKTVFDYSLAQQKMSHVSTKLMNPLACLTFGGKLLAKNFQFSGTKDDIYAGTDYRAWAFKSIKIQKKDGVQLVLHTEQTSQLQKWKNDLDKTIDRISKTDKQKSKIWWNNFWKRSFVESDGEAETMARNYTLFRYMLGCNAHGDVPTKFNGGLFTFDPCFVDSTLAFTPDFRKWGGGTMTAQNQRLVYWGMLKSGDFDLMKPQFDFYLRMLPNAIARSKTYWGHDGACFTEQLENFGMPNPAEYGSKRPAWFDNGLQYNAWLEYEWDTVLEFCQMILETKRYNNADISKYVPLIENVLKFFDEHYQYLATRRGRKALDGDGHLVLFPGSACETYKMTNNSTTTIAALRSVLETYKPESEMLKRIPPIPFRIFDGKKTIAPAKTWERLNNVETPQLYPVFPWHIYGVGKPDLEIARNTYLCDSDAVKFRSAKGWKQNNIWAADLGLTDEALRLEKEKMADGPYRFPAFWEPGFDWAPDFNHGGTAMIGLQEMLLQTVDDTIYLFPAWKASMDVHFRLYAPNEVVVEAELKGGNLVDLKLENAENKKIILCNQVVNKTEYKTFLYK